MEDLNAIPGVEGLAAEIEAMFRARVEAGKTPGAFGAIFDGVGTLRGWGAGSLGAGRAAPDADTYFRIASCTKSMTAALLMMLRDAGALTLDDPITRYVPELTPLLPASAPAVPTLRMLMSMSGGLLNDDPWADRQEALTSAEFRAIVRAGVQFQSVPGTVYEYSNIGYALLGQAIEAVTGQSFVEAVSSRLLAPLGLGAVRFDFTEVPEAARATGHRRVGAEWRALPFSGPGAFSCIGGALTTPRDLAAWAGWLGAAFGSVPEDGPVLSAASRREMQQIHCPILDRKQPGDPCPQGYGLGLVVEEHPRHGRIVHHSGGYPGFSAHMRWSTRSGLGVVAFENATYSGAREPATRALERLLDALPERREPPEPPAAIWGLVPAVLALLGGAGFDDGAFLGNVVLDRPAPERLAEIAGRLAEAGAPDLGGVSVASTDGRTFSRFTVTVPCVRGDLVFAAQVGPTLPARIQALTVTFSPRV